MTKEQLQNLPANTEIKISILTKDDDKSHDTRVEIDDIFQVEDTALLYVKLN